MSKGTLGQVVKRAISDAGFRRQLQSDPEGALKGFDLSSDERAALRSGDASKLTSLGIDQRMSKTFAMGEGAAAVSKWGTGADYSLGATIPDGGEPLVSDALISGGGGRASDALISDAGGSVRGAVTDGSRLGQVNAAFEGGDSAAPHTAVTDGSRLGQVNAAFEGGDSAAPQSAIRDSHDSARAAFPDGSAAGRSAIRDSHDSARAAFPDGTAAGRSAIRDSHDSVRTTVSDTAGSREGSAYITADEQGNDAVATGGSAGGQASLDVSGQVRGSAAITADEAGNDVAARGTQDFGQQSSLDVSGNTRDASVISGDVAGPQGDAVITADESGRMEWSGFEAAPPGADPTVYSGYQGVGGPVAARGTQDYGQQTSLDVSGNTRDTSAISGDAAGRQGDAFITADEMGNDVTAAVRAPEPDTALTQRALADDAAMANPEAFERPDPTA